jgi:hypothetical protein
MNIVAWSRGLAVAGAGLTTWVAVDSLLGGGSASGSADESQFLLLWGLPFAVAAVFLVWYAVRGRRVETRHAARQGCLGAFLAGAAVFILSLAISLFQRGDLPTGVVAGFLYAPIATVFGLGVGVVMARMRKRRP